MSEEKESFEGGESACGEATMGIPGENEESSPVNTEAASAEEGETGPSMEELKQILAPDLSVLLANMANALQGQAWRHLGLVANPVTQEIEKDMQKAKISIDVFAFIAAQVSPLVSESQRRDLQSQVSTLQMNFVEQGKRG